MIKLDKDLENVLLKICRLIEADSYVLSDFKIDIQAKYFILRFLQKERYDLRWSCEFDFGPLVLAFDDVEVAIEKNNLIRELNIFEGDKYNFELASYLYHFLMKNRAEACEFPPRWFLAAVQAASERYAQHFPEVASNFELKARVLWNYWRRGN